ncbi:MAG TPA: type ISP restriction/modification enzyme [Acetobacteraceae bacterium]|nr:type ISP restriction/modification enzyme [Acetobacteraceae bacterium]
MVAQAATEALISFAHAVRLDRRANPGNDGGGTALELLLAPRFQALVETLLAQRIGIPPRVLPEYRRPGIGRPDLAFAQPAQPARSFIELKEPGKQLDPKRLRGHDADQFRRFRELPLWGFCNFHSIHLYQRGEIRSQAVLLPVIALDPGTSDATADRLIRRHDSSGFLDILEMLALAQPTPARNAKEFAQTLAHAARLLRRIVADQCAEGAPPALDAVREIFRETLFAHAVAGGYEAENENELFANAFAQTLSFGLLLAREASGRDVDRDAFRQLSEGTYPLLRATLQALTLDQVLDTLGVGFDVIRDTVNQFAPEMLTSRRGYDPILYFYEDFLAVFDEAARIKYGVFFTPANVVRYIVTATDRALREGLRSDGLLDHNVVLLDPACGTGTFPVATVNQVALLAEARYGEGMVPAEVLALSRRMLAFELLVGPYTIAHYRMLREITSHRVIPLERLPIYLTDTLSPSVGQPHVPNRLDFIGAPIEEERRAADAVKSDRPILAIFGNPPYRRLKRGEIETLVGSWMNTLWEDLKQPVRDAGFGRSLNPFPDLYVAFWRWALWRLFEAPGAAGRGVVSFVTNRGFLAGRAFGGLRQMLRQRFDVIEIVDLRGDNRGALPVGAGADENVFDIETGVCITTAWATGRKTAGAEASVRYADCWHGGAYRRAEKFALLDAAAADAANLPFRDLPGGGMDRLKPVGFAGRDWPALDELLAFRSNGIVTYRDDFAYALTRETMEDRIRHFLNLPPDRAAGLFKESAASKVGPALSIPYDPAAVQPIAYRPLDRRWLYNKTAYIDRLRPDLQSAWGAENICLIAPEDGAGRGPAVWCHGAIPDQHAFRGSYGGWVFPLHRHAGGRAASFLHPNLLTGLTAAYGAPPPPQTVFDAILALLSAASYTTRFAADLEDDFPHVPLPASPEVFADAAALGAAIRGIESFSADPLPQHRLARLTGTASGVTLSVPTPARAFLAGGAGTGSVLLQTDGSLRVSAVPERAWMLEVSGYRVLYRWLAARNGEALDAGLLRAILDLVWRIAELAHLFDAADAVSERAVASVLTRTDLGLPHPSPGSRIDDALFTVTEDGIEPPA